MLLTEARVLLLFDPTRGVDVGTKGEIFQLMRDARGQGLRHPRSIPAICRSSFMSPTACMVMRNGRIAATLEGEAHLGGRRSWAPPCSRSEAA